MGRKWRFEERSRNVTGNNEREKKRRNSTYQTCGYTNRAITTIMATTITMITPIRTGITLITKNKQQ